MDAGLRPGRILLTLVALATSTGCFMADWNETHIYNPLWPGHAKFHNGQTMSMGLLLGLATLYYLYVPLLTVPVPVPVPQATKAAAGKGEKKEDGEEAVPLLLARVRTEAAKANLSIVAFLASLYWVTQLSAYAYPGSEAFDVLPNTTEDSYDPLLQVKLDGTMFVMTGLGWWLERRRLQG